MDRFKGPTREEEDWQLAIEMVHEELFEELGREPTDQELEARLDYYDSEYDDHLDSLIDEHRLIQKEEENE